MTHIRTILICVFFSAFISGCSVSNLPGLYRVEVQQGNLITEAELEKLQPGLSRQQVLFLLGSPSITDPFHPDRWDYAFQIRDSKYIYTTQKMTVFFDKDTLTKVEGKPAKTDIVADLKEEPSFWKNLLGDK